MDHTLNERTLETNSPIEIIRGRLASVDRYSSDQTDRLSWELWNEHGESMVERIVDSINNSEVVFAAWKVMEERVIPRDCANLAKFLAKEFVSGAVDRSVKSSLLERLIAFSVNAPVSDCSLILEDLKKGQQILTNQIDELLSRGYSIDSDGLTVENEVIDLYDFVRARILYGDEGAISEALSLSVVESDDNLKAKIDRLKTLDTRTIRYLNYQQQINSASLAEIVRKSEDIDPLTVSEAMKSILTYKVEEENITLIESEAENLEKALEDVYNSENGQVKLKVLRTILTRNRSAGKRIPAILIKNGFRP